jgi:hypothetical protein
MMPSSAAFDHGVFSEIDLFAYLHSLSERLLISRSLRYIALGHRNLQSTARYTALAPDRFAKFWKD